MKMLSHKLFIGMSIGIITLLAACVIRGTQIVEKGNMQSQEILRRLIELGFERQDEDENVAIKKKAEVDKVLSILNASRSDAVDTLSQPPNKRIKIIHGEGYFVIFRADLPDGRRAPTEDTLPDFADVEFVLSKGMKPKGEVFKSRDTTFGDH